jgi:hypothetical protein
LSGTIVPVEILQDMEMIKSRALWFILSDSKSSDRELLKRSIMRYVAVEVFKQGKCLNGLRSDYLMLA